MSKYTDEQRSEILQRHQAGEDERAIAATMGVNPFGVRSVINWARVKAGEIPDPLAGQRGRKPKAEDGDPEFAPGVPNVKVQIGPPRAAAAPRKAAAPLTDGMPIFSSGATRLEVHRIRANPSSAGEGYLADEDGTLTLAQIKDRFGGGLYEFRAFAAGGSPLGKRRETLSGPSVPVENESAQNPFAAMFGRTTDHRMLEMWERQRVDDERRRQDDREREERRRQDEREREERRAQLDRERTDRQAQAEREWLAAQQAMSREQSQAMIQLITSVIGQQKGTSLTEVITAAVSLRDLTDGGEDATAALAKNAPALIDGLKDLWRMRQAGPGPGELGQPELTDQQLAQAAMQRLLSQGLSREEAMQHLSAAFGYLDNKVAEKKKLQARTIPAARRVPSAPPQPPGGVNGASGAAATAGSQPQPQQTEAQR